MEETVTLEAEGSGERLDVFVARRCPRLSRTVVQRLIRDGSVTVGGRPGRAAQRLEPGDRVLVRIPPEEPETLRPEPTPLTIVYEDEDLLVIDKPAGLTVHPAAGLPACLPDRRAGQAGMRRGTLAAALLAYRPELASVGGPERPGIVHRLDRDTSGLLVVAKNEAARAALARQWKERQVEKGYLALVHGRLEPSEAVVDAPIGRDPRHRQRMAVVEGGRAARTAYRVRRYLPAGQAGRDVYSLVEVTPSTGRTHQIRVHFAALGHPLVGDRVYGRPSSVLRRQFLHAHRLAFRHPVDGRPLEFESPLPEDLQQALERLAVH
jgi:23S rRNA pseudouridine1911/1915/1917 synthase